MDRPAAVPHAIRKIFDGRVFTVTVESITLPNGHPLDAEIIRHPGSVVLLPVTDEGALVLVRQYRHAIGRWVWELPAGTLKKGEDASAAAARECQEEMGLIAGELIPLGALYPTPGYCDEEMSFYKATRLRMPGAGDAAAMPDEDEDIQSGVFALAHVRSMIRSGEIIDMKTVAAIALLEP